MLGARKLQEQAEAQDCPGLAPSGKGERDCVATAHFINSLSQRELQGQCGLISEGERNS